MLGVRACKAHRQNFNFDYSLTISNMQFRVPKFLDREANIAFGLSFKKLAVAGGLGVFLFVSKYMLPQFLWVIVIILTAGGFAALTFIKVGGLSMYELLMNSFSYFSGSRTYVWKQKQGTAPMKIVKTEVKEAKDEKEPLKIAPTSRLGGLRNKVDLGSSSGTKE